MSFEMPQPVRVDFAHFASVATTATSTRQFLTVGGGALALSLLWNEAVAIWRFVKGEAERIDWIGPIGRAVAFGVLLGGYAALVSNIMLVINSLGTFDTATGRAEALFLKRVLAFQKAVDSSTTTFGFFANLTFDSVRVALTQFITWLSYLFTLALVYVLKHLQAFTLATIINYGPVLLGFASLGGFFGNLALSWFWALVEVSFWGVTMNILLVTFDKVPITVADGASTPLFWTEITVNLVYAIAVASVPAITSSLIKGHSIASLGTKASAGVLIAGGVAAAALRSAPSRGQAAYGAAKDLGTGAAGLASGVAAVARGTAGQRSASAENRFMSAARGAVMAPSGGSGAGGSGRGGGGAANARARHFAIKSAQQRKGG